jgi:hypothetical protein
LESDSPIDCRAQSALPWQRCATAPSQQGKAVVDVGGDLLHREHAQPGSSQLDGQRHAVQMPAYLDKGSGIFLGQHKPGPAQLRPI